mmetsp:Transcript_14362/g.20154  ORF Transcript_14362/g.20154 Transcript_14362/m.20154 type:complete len:229 (-) Transcript_14362:179-865(-)
MDGASITKIVVGLVAIILIGMSSFPSSPSFVLSRTSKSFRGGRKNIRVLSKQQDMHRSNSFLGEQNFRVLRTCCSLQVREASLQDLDEIKVAFRGCNLGTGWSNENWEREVNDPNTHILVAEELDDPATTVFAAIIVAWHIVDQLEIGNLFVLPCYRRKGVATKLLEQLCKKGEQLGAREILLEVRESNEAARQLYKDLGFIDVGQRPNYYDGVETAIFMSLSLPSVE